MAAIITVTPNPAIDKSSSVDKVVPEDKLRCNSPSFEPGGGGLNVSRAIKNLGGESVAIYTAGGHTGALLKDLLDKADIEHYPVETVARTRENLTVLDESTSKQYRFNMPGTELREREWQGLIEKLEQYDAEYIVASGSLPPGVPDDFFARIPYAAAKALPRARLIVDTSCKPLDNAAEQGAYLIKPNRRELGQLVGKDHLSREDLREAAQRIISEKPVEVLFVSMADEGALLATKDGIDHIPAPQVEVISKVGAGDSTVAGITLALSRGKSLKDAARFGVACGAAAVMTPGTELCRREDAERLYEEMLSGKW